MAASCHATKFHLAWPPFNGGVTHYVLAASGTALHGCRRTMLQGARDASKGFTVKLCVFSHRHQKRWIARSDDFTGNCCRRLIAAAPADSRGR